MTDDETFNFKDKDEGDEDRELSKDVIYMDRTTYAKTFCADPFDFSACTPPTRPWFIAFVKFKRTDQAFF